MRRLILFSAALLAVIPATARGQVPAGPEFPVNSYTTGNQGVPAVATDAKGNFVVVWGGYYGIAGQRFGATGVPQGGEFVVDASGYGNPAVASTASGGFVVGWAASDDADEGVFGQRFDAAGATQGGAFQVNSYTTGRQFGPAVAADASGNFVVVWQSIGQDGNGYGVFGQRFDVSGARQGDEFQVNAAFTGLFGDQFSPAVDSDGTGNFVVVWNNISAFGPQTRGIFGQRFNPAGVAQGDEFRVNVSTSERAGSPHVALAGNGNFVVVWSVGFGFPLPDANVMGRRFAATGTPLDAEFRVNNITTGRHGSPSVDSDANGNFVVAWEGRTGRRLLLRDCGARPSFRRLRGGRRRLPRQLVYHRQPAQPRRRLDTGRELRRGVGERRQGRERLRRLRPAVRGSDLQEWLRHRGLLAAGPESRPTASSRPSALPPPWPAPRRRCRPW